MVKGIDVSAWQGSINWNKVKGDGVEVVILKAGGSDDGFYTDSKFEENYKGAKAVGLKVGAYYFVGHDFVSAEDGVADADRFIEIIKGKKFDAPLYVDVEATSPSTKAGTTQATIEFCTRLEKSGYMAGIYASEVSGFRDRLDDAKLKSFVHWVACYGSEKPDIPYVGWQYSSSGKISGIDGNVDMDEFKDLSETIIQNGLNGYEKGEKQPQKESQKEYTIETSNLPVLHEGCTGEAVKVWQSILGVTIDGSFGPATDRATREYQKRHGLLVDGSVGPQTWKYGLSHM